LSEDLLQFVWQHRYWDHRYNTLTNGADFEVIDTGAPNYDSGPDFFNAKIKVGNTVWAGNVEIHTSSSQWFRHNHHLDKAYDNVVLHVVYKHDREVTTGNGMLLPVFEMKIPEYILGTYAFLLKQPDWPACSAMISSAENEMVRFWLNRCAVERLESKVGLMYQRFRQFNNDWEALWLSQLGEAMGCKVNKEPFGLLMQRTPLKLLQKYSHDLFSLEALLFGQAGLLDDIEHDDYSVRLKTEYDFIKKKFGLQGLPGYLWKFARMRPGNFPTLRLAQFAALVHKHPAMVTEMLEMKNYNHISSFFSAEVSEYWHTHFRFGAHVKHSFRYLGSTAVDLILINVVVPFLFFYGKYNDSEEHAELALDWLSQTKAENNTFIRRWSELGIKPANALESQALLHLRENFCLRHRCPQCNLGNIFLTSGHKN